MEKRRYFSQFHWYRYQTPEGEKNHLQGLCVCIGVLGSVDKGWIVTMLIYSLTSVFTYICDNCHCNSNLHIKVICIICMRSDSSCVQAPKTFHLASSTWLPKIGHFVPSLPAFELDEKLLVLNVCV